MGSKTWRDNDVTVFHPGVWEAVHPNSIMPLKNAPKHIDYVRQATPRAKIGACRKRGMARGTLTFS